MSYVLMIGVEIMGGAYLQSCDVDARDGWGYAHWTQNIADAKRFADVGEALEFWKRQSTVRPMRPDGKPNRPLTAFTVTFQTIEES